MTGTLSFTFHQQHAAWCNIRHTQAAPEAPLYPSCRVTKISLLIRCPFKRVKASGAQRNVKAVLLCIQQEQKCSCHTCHFPYGALHCCELHNIYCRINLKINKIKCKIISYIFFCLFQKYLSEKNWCELHLPVSCLRVQRMSPG